jgi:hypothetical protein
MSSLLVEKEVSLTSSGLTAILSISTSCVARITGMSHHTSPNIVFFRSSSLSLSYSGDRYTGVEIKFYIF